MYDDDFTPLMSEYRDEDGGSGGCGCAGCTADWQDEAAAAYEAEVQAQEHMVAVVFDVVGAINPEDAARIVRDALRMHDGSHFRAALTEVNTPDRFVEAWWFPERGDKHIDGNDRPAATLTWVEEDLVDENDL